MEVSVEPGAWSVKMVCSHVLNQVTSAVPHDMMDTDRSAVIKSMN
jgi:hypothetical protein